MILRLIIIAGTASVLKIKAEKDLPLQTDKYRANHEETSLQTLFNDASPFESPLAQYNDTPMSNVTGQCKSIMHTFALAGGSFTKCLLDHARPFRMCEKCVADYTHFIHLYDDLQNDKKCTDYLLLADRVQVVTTTYRNFKAMWADAYCDKCYDSVGVNSTSGEVHWNFTADVVILQNMQANVSQCFTANVNTLPSNDTSSNISAVCTVCRNVYEAMNQKYLTLKDKNGGHMCMDMVDMMNYTRLMWSRRFQCSRPMPSPVSVIVICVVAALAVFVFYISMPFTAYIRRPQILKAKRMGTSQSQSVYGSVSEEVANRSLPRMATTPTSSLEARRRLDSQRHEDSYGIVSNPRSASAMT